MNGQERNKQSLEALFSARDDSRKPIESNAYTDGYDAYYNRLEESDNPYFKAANPIEQQEWERGWKVAEQDYMAQLFGAQEGNEMLYNSRRPIKSASSEGKVLKEVMDDIGCTIQLIELPNGKYKVTDNWQTEDICDTYDEAKFKFHQYYM
jgi:hypothetical protein